MISGTTLRLIISVGVTCLLSTTFVSHAQQSKPSVSAQGKRHAEAQAEDRVSVAVARDRATVMHKIYESTLHVMHRHYFRPGRAPLPARALEDVFAEMEADSKTQAHWIAVNTKAMSIDNEPETEFENQAVRAISAGKDELELVEDGFYRRATAIPLGGGCIGCHTSLQAPPPPSPRYAGLVISIPVKLE